MPKLKDGSEVEDPRLGRIPLLDPRNRDYPLEIAPPVRKKHRSRAWSCRLTLDQRSEGACTSFAVATQSICTPAPLWSPERLSFDWLVARYHEAQKIDPWEGCYLGRRCPVEPGPQYSGTSEEAALTIYRDLGFYREFRWGFGIEDLVLGIGWKGPAVVGTDWYESMYEPVEGQLVVAGAKVGGHMYCVRGVYVPDPSNWLDGDVVVRNSWGDWGDNGDARMKIRTMASLLESRGTVAFQHFRSMRPKGLK